MIVSSQKLWFGEKKLLATVIIDLTCNLEGHKIKESSLHPTDYPSIPIYVSYTSHTTKINQAFLSECLLESTMLIILVIVYWVPCFRGLMKLFWGTSGQFSRPVSRQLSTIWSINSLCPHPSDILVRCCSHTTLIHESFMYFRLKMDNELLSSR